MNYISLKKAGLDVMQSHPLCRTCFGQYQASSAALGWPGDGDCYLIHQVAGLIYTTGIAAPWMPHLSVQWSFENLGYTTLCTFTAEHLNNSLPVVGKPSCLQTTSASLISHESSHTVPHTPLEHSSTRPSIGVVPPTSLKSPVAQGAPDTESKQNGSKATTGINLITELISFTLITRRHVCLQVRQSRPAYQAQQFFWIFHWKRCNRYDQ